MVRHQPTLDTRLMSQPKVKSIGIWQIVVGFVLLVGTTLGLTQFRLLSRVAPPPRFMLTPDLIAKSSGLREPPKGIGNVWDGTFVALEPQKPQKQLFPSVSPKNVSNDATSGSAEHGLTELTRRLAKALRPYQMQYWSTRGAKVDDTPCERTFSGPHQHSFLAGCPAAGCQSSDTLEEAKNKCSKMKDCAGITSSARDSFETRQGAELLESNGETSWVYESCFKKAEPVAVWHTFRKAMDEALADKSLNLNVDLGPPRDDSSILIAISAYRDSSCAWSVRRAFERAEHPEKVNVAVVQQNCEEKCMVAEGWGNTRRLHPGDPDADCVQELCKSRDLGHHCKAGRVRILRLGEPEALGPLFARYLNAKMWRGENYYLQIDAHTDFREGWDTDLVAMMKDTPSYPRSVISNYPPSGDPKTSKGWPRKQSRYDGRGLCECMFERMAGGRNQRYTVRLNQPGYRNMANDATMKYTGFMAAGFFFAHSSFLQVAGPDPFLPYIFMGEEIMITMRMWTSGYDIYAPRDNVLAHEYVRTHGVKFWETVDMVFKPGFHNAISNLVLARMQSVLRFPEAVDHSKLEAKDLLARLTEFGPGSVRSLENFIKTMGLDLDAKRQTVGDWCIRGVAPPLAAVQDGMV